MEEREGEREGERERERERAHHHVLYSAASSACEKAGEWVRALQFLECMANNRVEPSARASRLAISACEQVGEREGRERERERGRA